MQVVVLLLLVAGLALLVLGLITGNTGLVLASIAASILAALTILRYRRRLGDGAGASSRPAADDRDGTPVRVPELVASVAPTQVAVPPAHAAAEPDHAGPAHDVGGPAQAAGAPGRATDPAEPAGGPHAAGGPVQAAAPEDDGFPSDEGYPPDDQDDEPPAADTDPPLRSRGDKPVWVIDGRPRYHLPGCAFLLHRGPEPVPLRQAVEDGFTPCALCDPDSGLADGLS